MLVVTSTRINIGRRHPSRTHLELKAAAASLLPGIAWWRRLVDGIAGSFAAGRCVADARRSCTRHRPSSDICPLQVPTRWTSLTHRWRCMAISRDVYVLCCDEPRGLLVCEVVESLKFGLEELVGLRGSDRSCPTQRQQPGLRRATSFLHTYHEPHIIGNRQTPYVLLLLQVEDVRCPCAACASLRQRSHENMTTAASRQWALRHSGHSLRMSSTLCLDRGMTWNRARFRV